MTNSNSSANTVNTTTNNNNTMVNNNPFAANRISRNNKFITNNSKSMVVSHYEIAINLGYSKAVDRDGRHKSSICFAGTGLLSFNGATNDVFWSGRAVDSKGNLLPVFKVYEDGTTVLADAKSFWSALAGTTTDGRIRQLAMRFELGLTADIVQDIYDSKEFKSLRVRISADASKHFSARVRPTVSRKLKTSGNTAEVRLINGDIRFEAESVSTGSNTYRADIFKDVKDAAETAAISPSDFFKECAASPVEVKLPTQTQAARAAVEAPVASNPHDIHFGAPAPKPAPKAAPVVDTEKEALRKENAELREEVKSLKTELASTNAKLDQILAMMSAQAAPVAEPTPVVEEPVAEEIPAAPAPAVSLDDIAADEPLEDGGDEHMVDTDEVYDPFAEEEAQYDEEVKANATAFGGRRSGRKSAKAII